MNVCGPIEAFIFISACVFFLGLLAGLHIASAHYEQKESKS